MLSKDNPRDKGRIFNPIVRAKRSKPSGVLVSQSCINNNHRCTTCNERWRMIKRWGIPQKLLDMISRYKELHPNESKKSLIEEISYVSGYPEEAIRYVLENAK